MLDNLRQEIVIERQYLNRHLDGYRALLIKCATEAPSEIELWALAGMLHAFYTGIENIFKRIVTGSGEMLSAGESWHRELLDAMTKAGSTRAAVISIPLRDRLREYLRFRHVFRQAYHFQLRWDKMASLTLGCEETLRLFEAELDAFLQTSQQA